MKAQSAVAALCLLVAACSGGGSAAASSETAAPTLRGAHNATTTQRPADSITTTTVARTTTAPVPDLPVPIDPISSSLETVMIDVDGAERSYRLFIPDLDGSAGSPALVVDMHGFTSDPDRHDAVSRLRTLAADEGFVVAQPAGLGRLPSWDASATSRSGEDDIAFIRMVVADVQERVPIDERRVYAMGFSNGGGMAHRLACDAADVFAAIGTVAGAYVDAAACDAAQPVAVASFHGTRDIVVPYAGAGDVFVNVPQWAAGWAERNGCTVGPVREDLFEDVYADAWSSCSAGADVVLFTVIDGLHSWPGSPDGGLFRSTPSVSATEVFWQFFNNHAR